MKPNDKTSITVRQEDLALVERVQRMLIAEGGDPTDITRGEAVRRALLAYLGESA